ncbi:SEC-C domain-containing protein [Planococcus sp. CP5-4]|uniref:plasmid pRiA4b ORF-3 family protein n=1 Tax=unclassified Planococcus (in: firmicutes) TaxID=2662419 RepID=UPI001C210BC3|nr:MULTISPECIES: plasmid pRiA4b ORF-3 family protein [unclassified Planococcus (in: firmicutes)]MBU9673919.1 SEC-C domain-containing protein [Planococcus sp. CP5-4_YE]MBV0909789.1 SEC-C domain-containing protein [Planococcus sp. CP5-4_UN]MBW6065273.1 SEC-C domain-containing protein [Planococcus sp. CP5-4]
MTGRNEPCPCGSGKKYKKCCGQGQGAGQAKTIEAELLNVVEKFELMGLRPETISGIEETANRWLDELGAIFPESFIEEAAHSVYAFVGHPEDWQAFLGEQLKRHPRAEVAEALRAWKRPMLMLAKVQPAADGRLFVKDEVSGRVYEVFQEEPAHTGLWVLGIALPCPSATGDAVLFMNGTLYMKEETPPSLIDALTQQLPAGDLLGLLKLLTGLSQDELPELPPFEQQVLEQVIGFLGPSAEDSALPSLTVELLERVKINARKPEAVAAGVIQAGADIGIAKNIPKQKQLAETFGVSVMTMLKYRDLTLDFLVRMLEETEGPASKSNKSGLKMDNSEDSGTDEILQFKVKLLRTSPPVWRRLQVDSRMSFAEFHEVLQATFEWDNDHLHEFRMNRSGGKNIEDALIGMDDEQLDFAPILPSFVETLDERAEFLEDWFVDLKDRAVYTYDFGADWEHEIILEKQLAAEPGAKYPRCVKAQGEAPGEYGFELEDPEWQASPDDIKEVVNDLLEPVQVEWVAQERHAVAAEGNDWQRLIQEMAELRKLDPWNWLHDDQVFVLESPTSKEVLFVSVLGAAGEEFGLAVYIGEEGYESLLATMNGTVPAEELIFSQRSLLASFSDRDELDEEDLEIVKASGMSFRGKKQWPLFRSMVPGYYPWSIDEEEVRLLIDVIAQTKIVLEKVRGGMDIPVSRDYRSFYKLRMDQDGQWRDEKFIVERPMDSIAGRVTKLMVPETQVAKLKKKKTVNLAIEYGQFFIDRPVQAKPGERPYFPLITAAIEVKSGLVLHQHIDGQKEKAQMVQQGLLKFIEASGALPKTLLVSEETARLIRPLTERLAIQVNVKKHLPELEQLKQVMGKM